MPKTPPLAPTVGLQALCVTPAKKAPATALQLSSFTMHQHRTKPCTGCTNQTSVISSITRPAIACHHVQRLCMLPRTRQ